MLPNLVYFLLYPESFAGFIRVNFFENLDYHHSTSFTRLLIAIIPALQAQLLKYLIMISLGSIIFFKSYHRFVNTPDSSKQYVHHFSEIMFLVLLVYPDSWFLFLAIWYSVFGPSMLVLYNTESVIQNSEKLLDILWSGANNLIAFFTIGVLLHYLVLGFDPTIPLWLISLYIIFQNIQGRTLEKIVYTNRKIVLRQWHHDCTFRIL
jgi:hypothetical protein